MRELIIKCDGCNKTLTDARAWEPKDLPIPINDAGRLDLCVDCAFKFKKILLALCGNSSDYYMHIHNDSTD